MRLAALKDRGLAVALKEYLSHRLKEYGAVQRVRIDSQKRTISVELLLEGETEPIEVVIEGFEIDGDAIRITGLRASRPWIEKLLKSFVAGRPFDLPPQIAKLLEALF